MTRAKRAAKPRKAAAPTKVAPRRRKRTSGRKSGVKDVVAMLGTQGAVRAMIDLLASMDKKLMRACDALERIAEEAVTANEPPPPTDADAPKHEDFEQASAAG